MEISIFIIVSLILLGLTCQNRAFPQRDLLNQNFNETSSVEEILEGSNEIENSSESYNSTLEWGNLNSTNTSSAEDLSFLLSNDSASSESIFSEDSEEFQADTKIREKSLIFHQSGQDRDQIFSLFGLGEREEEFAIFEGIIFANTTSIHLKNIEIDSNNFTRQINGLKKLRSLTLENVKFTNLSKTGIERVYLPALQSFYFKHVYDPMLWQVTTFQSKLKSLVFFDKFSRFNFKSRKIENKSWNVSQIWGLGVEITVMFDVIKVLEISHKNSELISSLKYTNLILENAKPLFRLSVRGTSIEPLLIPISLTYLNLQQVDIPLVKLGEILFLSENLTDLHLSMDKRLETKIDISALPRKIKNLSLHNFLQIEINAKINYSLSHLTLSGCTFPYDYVYDYYQLERVQKISIFGPCYQNSDSILYSIMQTNVEWIYLSDFYTNSKQVEVFLKNSGVPENKSDFILKKVNENKWIGKELFQEKRQYLKSTLSGMSQFIEVKHHVPIIKADPNLRRDIESEGLLSIELEGELDLAMLEMKMKEGRVEKEDVGMIHLNNVEIPAEAFTNFLQGFINLKYLSMINIEIFGNFSNFRNAKIFLPKLSKFNFHEYWPSVQESLLENSEISKDQLKAILFFDKSPSGSPSWDLEKLYDLKVDISVSIGHIKYLQINHGRRELVSRLSYSHEIYKNWHQLNHLFLSKCPLNPSTLPLKNLKSLSLFHVNITGKISDFQTSLRLSDKLTDLYLFPKHFQDDPISIDISNFPKNLKNVVLRDLKIQIPNQKRKFDLESLAFYDCQFPLEYDIHFQKYFNINQIVGFFNSYYRRVQSPPNHKLLNSLFKTKAQSIYLYSFNWRNFDNLEDFDFQQQQDNFVISNNEIVDGVDKILTAAGIEKGTKDFKLEKVDGKWVGTKLDLYDKFRLKEWLGDEHESKY